MKCEICHQHDAETAICRKNKNGEEELYVCKACAATERARRQKKSQRTRKVTGLPPGMELSVTEFTSEGDDDNSPPPFLASIMDALDGMVSDLSKKVQECTPKSLPEGPKYVTFPTTRVEKAYRFGPGLHLEGLALTGELEAVHRAMHALKMKLVGVNADGVTAAGHVYTLNYSGPVGRAKRVLGDLLRQEQNARVILFEEMPRVFADSVCRALAILKNCRLLSQTELFDLLSPLRLALLENSLDGITLREVESLADKLDLSGAEDQLEPPERDRVDSERADKMNERFEDVMLNERGEGKSLL